MRRFLRTVGAFVLASVPRMAFAEVSDKVASIPEHWIRAVPIAVLLLLAGRWRWWLALPLALPVTALIWAGVGLPTEPFIGAALIHEQGWGYFVSLWSSDFIMVAGLIIGAFLGWRGRSRIGAPLPNQPLQRTALARRR